MLLLPQALFVLRVFNVNLFIICLYDSRITVIVNPFVNSSLLINSSYLQQKTFSYAIGKYFKLSVTDTL
jgi:hypothetical protein